LGNSYITEIYIRKHYSEKTQTINKTEAVSEFKIENYRKRKDYRFKLTTLISRFAYYLSFIAHIFPC